MNLAYWRKGLKSIVCHLSGSVYCNDLIKKAHDIEMCKGVNSSCKNIQYEK